MVKKIINDAFELLFNCYGRQYWWPGETPWEVCTGAVLTQNTNWRNVEKAIELLKLNNALCPEKILNLPSDKLEQAIRPSGFFRLKAVRLRAAAEWWMKYSAEVAAGAKNKREMLKWRESLLAVNGIGPETADSILLYCFELPVFVIDTYTRRISNRHFGTLENISYQELQKIFMDNLPEDVNMYNEYHALLVKNSKEFCHKNICAPECPLRHLNHGSFSVGGDGRLV